MKLQDIESSVFLEEKPSKNNLKSCTFFWDKICVYESFIEWFPKDSQSYEIPRLLFENGILKIAVDDVKEFKNGLSDKIYASIDSDFLDFLYRNADKITIINKLPSEVDKIIKATEIDKKDKKLQNLIDFFILKETEDEHLEALNQNGKFPFDKLPEKFQLEMLQEIKKLAKYKYRIMYESFPSRERYGFEWRNESLLLKLSVSSAIFSSFYQLPYYYYKFSDFRKHDANLYLKGLNAAIPFVKKETIDDFSFEEILNIRKNRRWKNAMHQLGEICDNVKLDSNTDEFEKEIYNKIVFEYQNALGETEMTKEDLYKNITKSVTLTGISFIPIIGNAISTISNAMDPIAAYFKYSKKQKNLPFFLNDIRKL